MPWNRQQKQEGPIVDNLAHPAGGRKGARTKAERPWRARSRASSCLPAHLLTDSRCRFPKREEEGQRLEAGAWPEVAPPPWSHRGPRKFFSWGPSGSRMPWCCEITGVIILGKRLYDNSHHTETERKQAYCLAEWGGGERNVYDLAREKKKRSSLRKFNRSKKAEPREGAFSTTRNQGEIILLEVFQTVSFDC